MAKRNAERVRGKFGKEKKIIKVNGKEKLRQSKEHEQ